MQATRMNPVSLPLLCCCCIPTHAGKAKIVRKRAVRHFCLGSVEEAIGMVSHLLCLSWTAWGFVVLQLAQWPTWTYAVCCPGCYEVAQSASSNLTTLRAPTSCQFELILSIIIISICWILLMQCIVGTGPVINAAVLYQFHKKSIFSKADCGSICMQAAEWPTIFFLLLFLFFPIYLEQKAML